MFEIYIDLDGVIFDNASVVNEALGKQFETPEEYWSIANQPGFFANLHSFEEALQFLEEVDCWAEDNGYRAKILTATGWNFQEVAYQKLDALTALGNPLPTLFVPSGINKQIYAHPRAILIDDTQKVLDAWTAKDGIGIHVSSTPDYDKILQQLKEVVYDGQT